MVVRFYAQSKYALKAITYTGLNYLKEVCRYLVIYVIKFPLIRAH
jgi:hypothetical protein